MAIESGDFVVVELKDQGQSHVPKSVDGGHFRGSKIPLEDDGESKLILMVIDREMEMTLWKKKEKLQFWQS